MVSLRILLLSFCCNGLVFLKKKPKHSEAGKGDKSRVTDKKKYADNWEKIFGKKKKNIRKVYSDDVCKIDEDGGPYEIDLSKLDKNNK